MYKTFVKYTFTMQLLCKSAGSLLAFKESSLLITTARVASYDGHGGISWQCLTTV